jgi:CheY-like chemotaxis protein
LLDVSMTGITGLDVLRELRRRGRLASLPVVVFSASETHRAESLRLGAVAFVLKDDAEGLARLIGRYAVRGPDAESYVSHAVGR